MKVIGGLIISESSNLGPEGVTTSVQLIQKEKDQEAIINGSNKQYLGRGPAITVNDSSMF